MTTSRFRVLVVAFAVSYTWYFTLADNIAKLPEDVQSILRYSGYGAVLPVDSPLYYAPFVAALVGCVGLFMLARWGRTMLLASTVLGVISFAFAGVSVVPAFDSFIGSISGTLGPIVLAIAFSPPIADRLSRASGSSDEGAEQPSVKNSIPRPDAVLVEVLRSSDEALLAVLESALVENDILFSLADDQTQDLFAAGRLGGYNFALGPARLFVRESDEAKVREILRELQAAS